MARWTPTTLHGSPLPVSLSSSTARDAQSPSAAAPVGEPPEQTMADRPEGPPVNPDPKGEVTPVARLRQI
jgi:hypothetical protein